MKDKVLVELIVPDIDGIFDIYIPINRRIGNIIELLNKSLCDLTDGVYKGSNKNFLYDGNGEKYPINELVRNTDIRNGVRIVLM